MLRMLGAEVIKVESFAGDALRKYGPFRAYDGIAPAFIAANVGKKSIAVDLKSAGGYEIACQLIRESDVVLENFRPGVMTRLGLDYEACKRLRPGIIQCSVTGYGQSGALRDYPAMIRPRGLAGPWSTPIPAPWPHWRCWRRCCSGSDSVMGSTSTSQCWTHRW
jgi:crotonobetainyl-CoA:carnitine CoA-transferase CaiB-like acyl-CoA transferase